MKLHKCSRCKVKPKLVYLIERGWFASDKKYFYECPECEKPGSRGVSFTIFGAHGFIANSWNKKNPAKKLINNKK